MKMHKHAVALCLFMATASSWADTTIYTPSAEAQIRTSRFYPTQLSPIVGGILTAPYSHGILRFQTPTDLKDGDTVTLKLFPYGLPLRGPVEYVYAYESNDLVIDVAEFNAGTLIGTIDIPANSNFGSTFTLDVTNFVRSVDTPYVSFNLQSDGDNGFTSLNSYSFQKSSQLIVATIPEPQSAAMMALGLFGCFAACRTRLRQQPPTTV